MSRAVTEAASLHPHAAVVFDCDGVLVDSEVIAIEIEVAALADVGIPMTHEGLAERYVGVSAEAMATALHEEFGVVLGEAWWARLHEASHAALAERVKPVPGIREVLEGLAVPACLASSSSHTRIELSLVAAGLIDLFPPETRFSAADVRRGKPAPDLFLHAAASRGWDPSACVVVEDSPFGVQAALAAGMDVIGFTAGGHAGPSWEARLRLAGAQIVAQTSAELRALLPG